MKWYKKQIDQLKKKELKKSNAKTTKPAFGPAKIKPNKIVIHSGMEKRSRDKTDAIS